MLLGLLQGHRTDSQQTLALGGAAGVDLYPFHVKDSSLPSLAEGVWPRLLQAAAARGRLRAPPPAAPPHASREAPSAGARTRAHAGKGAEGRDGMDPAMEGTQPAGGSRDGGAAFLLAEPHFEEVKSGGSHATKNVEGLLGHGSSFTIQC